MWSPDIKRRFTALTLAIIGTALVAGCTLAPVHSTAGPQTGPYRYAAPDNRLEQVFFQALSSSLTPSADPLAPVLDVQLAVSTAEVGVSDIDSPVTDRQVTATAAFTITEGESVLRSDRRTTTAGYRTAGSSLSRDAGATSASENAVRALADSVRLALLADAARTP
ncbi:hypothetical protein [Pelagibacterium montanilacus]|uniref:hypothetical protein n=1 Tax=Pelagibacterium montanilacus TaxID=2185280 RepID=UPI0013E0B7D4|nr:hypothetical protein [Pelagibacterium montanilacus]